MNDSQQQIADLSPERRRLLELLRRQQAKQDSARLLPLTRTAGVNTFPLSFAQQRLWFIDQFQLGSSAYTMLSAIRLRGPLSAQTLERSLNAIIARHESLRTTFVVEHEQPLQWIAPALTIALPVIDLTGLSAAERESAVQQRILDEARQPFVLAQGPLLRAVLLRLHSEGTRQEHVLILTLHHIICDGWSQGLLIRELTTLYRSFAAGHEASPLPPLLIQYADYAVWQRAYVQGKTLDDQLGYWKRQLAGLTRLQLPTDQPRSAVQTITGARYVHTLAPELTAAVVALSQCEGATLFQTLLTAFQIVLARYSGQDDIAVGSGIANRNRAEIEPLIGFFVNTLVLRADLSGNPTFREALRRVRETTLAAYAHQDLPFEKLVEDLQPERDLSAAPLFQVSFVLQNTPLPTINVPPLSVELLETEHITTKLDLSLSVVETAQGLRLRMQYNAALFESATIERLLAHFQLLLQGIVADPERRIAELPLLTTAEQQQILHEWNATAAPYPEACFQDLFAEQAAHTPGAVALVYGDQELTYAELDRRANQLAWQLQALGVGPECRVGLCLARSFDLIVGMLAIFKAGGGYVPLDPTYPADRLSFMLADTQPTVLLTQADLVSKLPAHDRPILCVDTDHDAISRWPEHAPCSATLPDNLAYIIFTSGSTGRPKGVLVAHRGLGNLARVQCQRLGLSPASHVLQLASLSFDGAVAEVASALLNGATLVLADEQTLKPGPDLAQLVRKQAITTLTLPPAALAVLAPDDLPGVQQLLVVGEACPPELAARWSVGRRFFNGYGPTETTVCASLGEVTRVAGRVPIGGPIANTRFYVLDAAMQPVPIGAPGELYLDSVGLARGYLNRPDITAERFLPDPFSATPGARLYKTGDLVRWLPDGTVDFLGRLDHQVKLRGFRIELEEIEALLGQHPAVRERVVLLREDPLPSGPNQRLVAYVTPQPDLAADDGQVALEGEQVAQWQRLYDESYAQPPSGDPRFNIEGWGSSYTGQPIPAPEMAEWVENTVNRILALRPRRVLEIGCGSGLLLFRVAPDCERYVGTDFSVAGINSLRQTLSQPAYALPQVSLAQCSADQLGDLTAQRFDTVVLNSVAQYFPSVGYLLQVVEHAVEAVADGGQIFLGDVRSLPLLDAFHASVQLFQTPDDRSCTDVWAQVQHAIAHEAELAIDPQFWTVLPQQFPQITRVEILPKRGQAQNELTRFRYDVVLHVGGAAPQQVDHGWLDWQRDGLSLTGLRERLSAGLIQRLGILGVPNARVLADVQALDLLESTARPVTVGELRAGQGRTGVDPEDLWALSELGYRVTLSWARGLDDGSYDVLLQPGDDLAPASFPLELAERKPWSAYTNDLLQRQTRRLGPRLRNYLQERLPEYMVPAAVMVLEAFPLTPNGKIDRKALPAPDGSRPLLAEAFVPPRTPLEEVIASVWADELGLTPIGVYDNFFALGGHSLLATQVITRLRQLLSLDLPLRLLFEAPTIATFAEQLPAQRSAASVPLLPVPRDGARLPLSFAQQRLWFLDQFQPGSTLYAIPAVVRLTGTLDHAALERSLSTIIARHEVLRTSFVYDETAATPDPWQEITLPSDLALPLVKLDPEADEPAVRAAVQSAISQPFDLRYGPLFRATIIQRSASEHILVVSIHHSIFDGWSQNVLIQELSTLYRGFVQNDPVTLPPLPVQYADYAVWQRQWLGGRPQGMAPGDVLERQLSYWRQQLAGVAPLDLPTDHPRPPISTERGAHLPFQIAPALAAELHQLSQRLGATLFMTLLAAFKMLLHRYSGQDDIAIGTPIAGRVRTELEPLIGFFVNTLVLHSDLSGQPTFVDLVARVRQTALDAYAHQDVPFELLVEQVQPTRDLSRSPLFQVMFILQNMPHSAIDLPGLSLESLAAENQTVKFDLTLTLSEHAEGLRGHIGYRTDLFEEPTIRRLIGHYQTLLTAIVAEPEQRIADVPLLTKAERHQLLIAGNATQQPYPQDRCLPELLAAQAARTPEAVGVIWGEQTLTYRELDHCANQLAHQLRALGVGPEVLVGVCLHRSLDLVIALLAVLKAGGGYVPLDPSYPEERIQYVLSDAEATVLLTETALLPALPTHTGVTLCLDRDHVTIAQQPVTPPPLRVAPRNLAYVLYTSGSTGRPKGVAIPHQALVNFLYAMKHTPGLTADDVVLALTTVAFDIAGLELWLPLLVGARLLLVDRDTAVDGARLRVLLETSGATVLQATPATWRLLLAAGWTGTPGLRALCGGEALPWDLADSLIDHVDELWNLYGPTETTVWSAATRVERTAGRIELGRPIANTQLYVVDADGQPVPPGVAGELWIGGDGLARGYLNRPDMTAEKFVPDPFSHEVLSGPGTRPGARLYRTGDQVRMRFDGTLEFLGRIDQQVKLRGYRIELGEIEAALLRHPAIQASVVLLREVMTNDKQLVAYVVGTSSTENQASIGEDAGSQRSALDSPAKLRDFLAQTLPPYMLPNHWVLLDAMPLTPNGKVDRKALPQPDHSSWMVEQHYVAPRNEQEETLAQIWSATLSVARVGINDNFFALGGNSLRVIHMVARARQAGLTLSVQQVFQHQTIAALAAVVQREPDLLPHHDALTGPVPLTISQHRFLQLNQNGSHHSNVASMFELTNHMDRASLAQAVQHVLAHHDGLRQQFFYDGTRWHSSIAAPTIAPPVTYVDLAHLPQSEQSASIEATATQLQNSFNLGEAPLMRVALFDCGADQPQRLLTIVHHLVTDGFSTSVWMKDLKTAYHQLHQGQAVQLPPKTTSIKELGERLMQHVQSGALEHEVPYWLADARTKVGRLPLDHADGVARNVQASSRLVTTSLSVAATRALLDALQRVEQDDIQVFEVLLAALTRVCTRWSASDRLVVQLVHHGRIPLLDTIDLSRTVSFIAFHHPMLLELEHGATPAAAVHAIRRQYRALPNYGIGYGLLRYLSDDHNLVTQLRSLPAPEVFFNYLGDQGGAKDPSLRPARESHGAIHDPLQSRVTLLYCKVWIAAEQLHWSWNYSEHVHRRTTIERLAHECLDELIGMTSALEPGDV